MLPTIRARAAAVIAGSALWFAACSDSDDPAPPTLKPTPPSHVDVVLRDVHGEALPLNSNQPYSPRMTCGRCHDIDTISHGYHFQQGRADVNGKIDERLTKPWSQQVAVLSPGMYGKW